RRTWGITEPSSLELTRVYLATIRAFIAGDAVTHHANGINYDGARIPRAAASVPLFLGAYGPRMAEVGGELADGVYLSWCTADSVAAMRNSIGRGASRVGRDPSQIQLAASVRVCIDDDQEVARRAIAAALLPYVRGWGGPPPRAFRASFERMGFASEMAALDRMAELGTTTEGLIDDFPDPMLDALGYFGPASGAKQAIRQRAGMADAAVVRVVPAHPNLASIHAVIDACRPGT